MPETSFLPCEAEHPFPIQNIPFGIGRPSKDASYRAYTALGNAAIDLASLESSGLLDSSYFDQPSLNAFMAAGRPEWRRVRSRIQHLLASDTPDLRDNAALRQQAILPLDQVEMTLPAEIGDYTDFYASRQHATNVGTMFRGPENALMPNWLHLPVGYHGRASSVVPSGTPIRRPHGQTIAPDATTPSFGPSRLMDFELEVGCFVGTGNALGDPIDVNNAADHLFGLVLVNDWSARDIQKWEYVPLGPFLGKNLGTSISPWIVTFEALEPFRTAGPAQDPTPLPYLQERGAGTFDIHLEARLQTANMEEPAVICETNFKHLYWSVAQQAAHHTITGCNLRPGDLLASGTISGNEPSSYGSMLELSWRGTKPLQMPSGEERKFLQDGDMLSLSGWAQGDGYRIGFGDVSGVILPARDA